MTTIAFCGSQEKWNMSVKERLCHTLYLTLIRLCGKTENVTPEELYTIAKDSISYPNNGAVAYPEGTRTDHRLTVVSKIGKPHDIELRVASKVFHKLKQRQRNLLAQQQTNDEEMRMDLITTSTNTTVTICNPSYVIKLRSDMGVVREFTSERCVAEWIAKTLEELILETPFSSCSSSIPSSSPIADSTVNEYSKSTISLLDQREERQQQKQYFHTGSSSSSSLRDIIHDVRADKSGIIFIVSHARMKQLRSIGRLPCSLCTQWCKGEKGLWWHQQQEHGRYHSDAVTDAKAQVNNLAIVPYYYVHNRSHQESFQQGSQSNGKTKTQTSTFSNYDHISGTIGEQPLDYMDLVRAGDVQRIHLLIEKGLLDPQTYTDRNGASPIHWAAGCGQLQLVIFLVESCGCSPHVGQKGKRAYSGRTPMHWAARNGHLDVVRYLFESCRADLELATDDGTTAFCWACWQGHLPVIRYLYKQGCNIHSVNSFGCNAVLWCAQGEGDVAVLEYLNSIGCKVSSINCNGHGVLHKAAQRGNVRMCQWFLSELHQQNQLRNRDYEEFSSAEWTILHVSPDTEGCCPSDLAGMEGHEELALRLSANEQTLAVRFSLESFTLPDWISATIEKEFISVNKFSMEWAQTFWGPGGGARRIAYSLIKN